MLIFQGVMTSDIVDGQTFSACGTVTKKKHDIPSLKLSANAPEQMKKRGPWLFTVYRG